MITDLSLYLGEVLVEVAIFFDLHPESPNLLLQCTLLNIKMATSKFAWLQWGLKNYWLAEV